MPPRPGLLFESEASDRVRILPLAIIRRKSLVNFDLLGHDGHAMSLAGLRENQALTMAIVRAWAKEALSTDDLDVQVDDFLEDVVYGDQTELTERAGPQQLRYPFRSPGHPWAYHWPWVLPIRRSGRPPLFGPPRVRGW